jgi:hypothetical protein
MLQFTEPSLFLLKIREVNFNKNLCILTFLNQFICNMKQPSCSISVLLLSLLLLFTYQATAMPSKSPSKVEIKKENSTYQLFKDGKPYFIKGAVGWDFLEELAAAGANSLRTSPKLLDEAHRLGFSVLVNLPVQAERSGFDYNDEKAVQEQFDKVKKVVQKYKEHPAVLMWAVGNELDHIPGDLDYNLKMWDAVNEIAGMIKETDPNHPVLTVVGYGKLEKIKDIKERCPNIDLLGVNAYAAVLNAPEWLRKYNWDRPYVVTEWGPSGWWEVPRTKTGVVIEETSTEKAAVYRERYEKVILGDPLCLGSYVFLWTSNRQERTHTWFNMFHNNLKTQTVEVMQYMWTGKWPENRAPQIEKLYINGKAATENIELAPGTINTALIQVDDPENDELKFEWELLPEPEQFGAYAGQGEKKPQPVEGFIQISQGNAIQFRVPDEKNKNYRLFVYVYDGQKNIAVANIPFYATESLEWGRLNKEWIKLFNGNNLEGWQVKAKPDDIAKEFWKVTNGKIIANSLGDSLHDYVWLMTDQEYGDFELELQFQAFSHSPGNSGIQIRSRYDESSWWLNGPQIDIHPPGPWRTGMMWDETRGNQRWIFPDIRDGSWVNPGMAINQAVIFFADSADVWNVMRVKAKGMNIKAWLNGTLITDFNGGNILNDNNHRDKKVGEKGHIALQIHSNDQLKIHFKDIFVKTLEK